MLRGTRDLVLLVAVAIAIGFVLARMAPARSAPAATPSPTPVVASAEPAPTPEPVDDDRVWQQPLVAGCTDGNETYLVSNGGGIARFDGKHWSLIDETLRQLRAITCVSGQVIAVGDGGRLIRIDPVARTIRPDVLIEADLYALGALDPRTMFAAGADLVVMGLRDGAWVRLGSGGGFAWRAVLARSATEVWFAGDGGQLFVYDGKTFVDRSVPDGPDLTALAPLGPDTLVGAADGRLFSVAAGRSARALARVDGAVRGLVVADASSDFVLGDELRRVNADASLTAALAHGLGCAPIAIFSAGQGDVSVLGRDGARAGLARFDGKTWTKTGGC